MKSTQSICKNDVALRQTLKIVVMTKLQCRSLSRDTRCVAVDKYLKRQDFVVAPFKIGLNGYSWGLKFCYFSL
jgi:hypothetical protein